MKRVLTISVYALLMLATSNPDGVVTGYLYGLTGIKISEHAVQVLVFALLFQILFSIQDLKEGKSK